MTRTVISGGTVIIDGALTATDIAIENGLVSEVGPGLSGDHLIDAAGSIVTPGLIDCHVHAQFDGMDMNELQNQPFSQQFFVAMRNLGTLLRSGITTVRDAGGVDLGVKTSLEAGWFDGPRMLISISALSQTGGHVDGWNVHGDQQRLMVPHPGRPDSVVDGVDNMRKRVRELIRAGADTIKVCASGGVMSTRDDPKHPQFSFEELAVCVEEAAAAGRAVMAHAHGAEGIKQAVRAGVRSIEHGVFLDDEAIELMVASGTWLVPTLLAPIRLVDALDQGMSVPPPVEAKARAIAETHLDSVRRAHEAGVRIAMGSDSGVFAHGSSPSELELLTRAGLTTLEAVDAATASAAELLGLETVVGRIAPGLAADLLILDTDELTPEAFTQNLRTVIQAGRIIDSAVASDTRAGAL